MQRFRLAALAFLACCCLQGVSGTPSSGAEPPSSLGLQDPADAGATCLAALLKLDKAVNIKMSLRDYSTRVAEARGELEKCLPRLSAGELKREMIAAMGAFLDAGSAWEEMVRFDFMAAEYEPGTSLQKKYSIETSESATGRIMARAVVLNTIWKEARRHVEKAAKAAE